MEYMESKMQDQIDGAQNEREECYHRIAELEAENAELKTQLGECYKISGADTDGADLSLLAPQAIRAVTDLRNDYQEALAAIARVEAMAKDFLDSSTNADFSFDEIVTLTNFGNVILAELRGEE